MNIVAELKNKKLKQYLSMPVYIWIILTVVATLFYLMYTYTDIILTTKSGITFWYIITGKESLRDFYLVQYPLGSDIVYAGYDFFIYIIFAIWDFPLFIFEKITSTSFENYYITLLYAKSIIIVFTIACSYEVYEIIKYITKDKERAGIGVFSFIFSILTLQTIVINTGYDVISVFFTLAGIQAYLKNENKKFIVLFACAITCKTFAIIVFIPLVLLRWKNILWIIGIGLISISLLIIPRLFFVYPVVEEGLGSVSTLWYTEYLFGDKAPLSFGNMPLFFGFFFLICVYCWCNTKKISEEIIIYISLLSMANFFLTCTTHPYWIILMMPYIAILECINMNELPNKLLAEVSVGIGYILWEIRYSPQCYGYNIINNMLKLEAPSKDFWFMGVGTLISKLSDMIGISVDNIYIVIRSVLAAAFIYLLFLLKPGKIEEKEQNYNCKQIMVIKAVCSVGVLTIPVLGLIVRICVG